MKMRSGFEDPGTGRHLHIPASGWFFIFFRISFQFTAFIPPLWPIRSISEHKRQNKIINVYVACIMRMRGGLEDPKRPPSSDSGLWLVLSLVHVQVAVHGVLVTSLANQEP